MKGGVYLTTLSPCSMTVRCCFKYLFWANSSFRFFWILHAVFLIKVIALVWQMFKNRSNLTQYKNIAPKYFVIYNYFRIDANDTALKWVERLRRLIFWWLEIWAIARSLLYRDQVHTLLFPTSKPNWFEYATNLDPSTEWLVLIGLNNFVASNIDELDSWYECVGKYDWFSCHISLNNLGQNLLYKCSKQPSWLFWVRHYWSEWRGLLSPAGIECST